RHTRFSRDWSSDVCSSDLLVDGGEQSITPGDSFRVNVAEAMSSAAEAGMGICLLPDYVAAPALQRGSLVRLLPHFRLPEKHIHRSEERRVGKEGKSRVDSR